MATKHPWQSLIGSLSESGHALHSLIMGHPASKFLNVSLIYNRIYHESQDTSNNLYYSRCRAGLLTLAILDETARILQLAPGKEARVAASSLPDAALRDLIVSLGYHPDSKMLQKLVVATRSPNGIRVSRVERRNALRTPAPKPAEEADVDVESTAHLFKPKPVPKEELDRNKTYNDISFNFVKGKGK